MGSILSIILFSINIIEKLVGLLRSYFGKSWYCIDKY